MRLRRTGPAVAVSLLLVSTGSAFANGAFPDSLGILLPEAAPHTLYAATNFGLVRSDDDGLHWALICEDAVGSGAFLYTLGPPPGVLYAVTPGGVTRSTDQGCDWTVGTGSQLSPVASDVFVDPSDPAHVLQLARLTAGPMALFASHDSGATYEEVLLTAEATSFLTGAELARSDPQTLYVTELATIDSAHHALLRRSSDGGASWTAVDHTATLGPNQVRLLQVDPNDPNRVFLRVIDERNGDALAVSTDGGQTSAILLRLSGGMTAFVLRGSGQLRVGGSTGEAWVSDDGGAHFARWANAPHLRALGERDGRLYAVADNGLDGFAVGVSDDDGETWQPLLDFQHLCGIEACGDLPATCAEPFAQLASTLSIPDNACDNLQLRPKVRLRDSSGCGCAATDPGALVAAGVLAILLRQRRPR